MFLMLSFQKQIILIKNIWCCCWHFKARAAGKEEFKLRSERISVLEQMILTPADGLHVPWNQSSLLKFDTFLLVFPVICCTFLIKEQLGSFYCCGPLETNLFLTVIKQHICGQLLVSPAPPVDLCCLMSFACVKFYFVNDELMELNSRLNRYVFLFQWLKPITSRIKPRAAQ